MLFDFARMVLKVVCNETGAPTRIIDLILWGYLLENKVATTPPKLWPIYVALLIPYFL